MFLDFSKAFDSIDRKYLLAVLEELNFGPDFINWVKTIYNNTCSCIVQNGNISEFFSLEKGVRQGCPLSALLFILSIEVLACKIRQDKDIQGIKLPYQDYFKNEVRISMYADDITVFVTNEEHVNRVVQILREFTTVSGLKLNSEKTEVMWIGSNKFSQKRILDLKWKLYPQNYVKSLGVYFSSTKAANKLPENWESKVLKIRNIIYAWKRRDLTMVGRIIVTKALLSSQLTYINSIINLPENVIKEINTMLYQFVWGGKEKVKRKTIVNDYERGGLKMIDLPLYLDSLKITWIRRLFDENITNWKNIALYQYSKCTLGVDIFKCNCNYKSLSKIFVKQLHNMNPFYRKLLEIWFNCKTNISVDVIKNPLSEVIWNNENIKYNGETLYFKDWIKNDFITISSLYNDDGSLKTIEHLNSKIKKPGGVTLEFLALHTAMPTIWRHLDKSNLNEEISYGLIYKTQLYPLQKCSSKVVRNILTTNMSVPPISQSFWERKFPNHNFDWQTIWKTIPLIVNEARLITLNWKILCNIYPTNILLQKMGKAESNKCTVCNEVDYLEHFFGRCKQNNDIWIEVQDIIYEKTGKKVELTITDILFGVNKNNTKENKLINKLIIICKMCISKFKYGKYPNIKLLLKKEINIRNI
jgi:hypothetical protein